MRRHERQALRRITMTQVQARGRDAEPTWLIVNGRVFEVGEWFLSHPGGPDAIRRSNNLDVTEGFTALHDQSAWSMLEDFCIGEISDEMAAATAPAPAAAALLEAQSAGTAPVALLGMNTPLICTLTERFWALKTDNTCAFVLKSAVRRWVNPPALEVFAAEYVCGSSKRDRSYTPTTRVDVRGTFELVVKVYFGGEHPDFPEGGVMTQYLDSLRIGGTIEVLGPKGVFLYHERGRYEIEGVQHTAKKFGFVCGGSGITPAFQVIQAMLSDAEDSSQISLIFAGRTEDDLILKDTIDRWAEEHHDRCFPGAFRFPCSSGFRRFYTLSQKSPPGWPYGSGRVTHDMFQMLLPPPAPDVLITTCGPFGMMDASRKLLRKVGHAEDQIFVF